MRYLRWASFLPFTIALISAPAVGAEVECISRWTDQNLHSWKSEPKPSPGDCDAAIVRGTIVEGDFEKVVALYRKNHPYLSMFSLISPGGNVDEAMEIGRFFRKYLITAVAPYKGGVISIGECSDAEACICASACALIWFGAPQRGGAVGMHRPYYAEAGTFSSLSPADAALSYKKVLNRVSRYLEEIEVPAQVIETMISTGSGELEWLEDDASINPPSFSEWKAAACGHFTEEEKGTLHELARKRYRKTATRNDLLLEDLLKKKDVDKYFCDQSLVSRHRQKLEAP